MLVTVTVGLLVRVFVGVFVAVRVIVWVGVPVKVKVGLLVGTGEPAEGQVGTGVARKVETAAPQAVGAKLPVYKLGQELLVMDHAVPPAMPDVPVSQGKMLASKVVLSVLQLVEGPYSPTKTG